MSSTNTTFPAVSTTDLPAGTALDAPEVETVIAKFVRKVPKSLYWLVTVKVFSDRTEVWCHAQPQKDRFKAWVSASFEQYTEGLLHWRLAAYSDAIGIADIKYFKDLER